MSQAPIWVRKEWIGQGDCTERITTHLGVFSGASLVLGKCRTRRITWFFGIWTVHSVPSVEGLSEIAQTTDPL